nr:[FeFe] hydrogenase H-cluster maturation GTPase HydF [Bacilli bacterium]
MNNTPLANRFAIGLFGKRNAGKSSLLNAIAGQAIAVTSSVAGTTTDPVRKAMELLPIGPVVFIDTAGLDDEGDLGKLRVEKTYEVLRKCHLVIVVVDVAIGITAFEREFLDQLRRRKMQVLLVMNKCDDTVIDEEEREALSTSLGFPIVWTSALTGMGIEEVKEQIIVHSNVEEIEPALLGDLIHPGDMVVLVTPIDKAAPKGRLILPQQQTIRDIIECDAMAVVTKEHELKLTLERLKEPPALVITDSQAFLKVAADTPPEVPLTSFSILFARQKGDLAEMVRGIRRIEELAPGDKVLIAEGCTHHRQSDDIGTVKIPRWIRQIAGGEIEFEWTSGATFPKDVTKYAAIVHCGGCMVNRPEMQYRMEFTRNQEVFITNYGMLIAYVMGILPRALEPFQAAKLALEAVLQA